MDDPLVTLYLNIYFIESVTKLYQFLAFRIGLSRFGIDHQLPGGSEVRELSRRHGRLHRRPLCRRPCLQVSFIEVSVD